MMRLVTKGRWSALSQNEVLPISGQRTTVKLRADGKARVYMATEADFSDEMLVGYGEGQIECEIHGVTFGAYLRIDAEKPTRVWVWRSVADQRVELMSDEVYASLERPEAMSPEMAMVERMMRANSLKFEAMRQEMLRLRQENDLETQRRSLEQARPKPPSGKGGNRHARTERVEPAEAGSAEGSDDATGSDDDDS